MEGQPCDDSESTCSDALSADGSLLDFFSGEPIRDQRIQDDIAVVGTPQDIYQSLESHEIRVIVLDPGKNFDDPIHCRFKITSIRWPIAYSALSYAWGELHEDDSHLTHAISLEGLPFKVTSTLYQALLRIRQHQDVIQTPLWIDAICINQSDPGERAAQVMIMDKVYSSASHLLIWLGEEIFPDRREPDLDDEREIFDDSFFDAHADLKMASWFKRRWVIQEAVSCQKPHSILSGAQRIAVNNISGVLIDPSKRLVIDPFTRFVTGQTGPTKLWRQYTLYENLIMFEKALCSDDRDKVYALRNISKDGDFPPIDYSSNVQQLWTFLALQWIEVGYVIQVLVIAARFQRAASTHRTHQWPSWIPDWRLEIGESYRNVVAAMKSPSLCEPDPTSLGAAHVKTDLGGV